MSTTQSSRQYETLSQAVNDLNKKGFNRSFDFREDRLACSETQEYYDAHDLKILGTYRFEAETNPDDSAVIYALEAKDGAKGLLIDAYGAYADADKSAFIMLIPKA